SLLSDKAGFSPSPENADPQAAFFGAGPEGTGPGSPLVGDRQLHNPVLVTDPSNGLLSGGVAEISWRPGIFGNPQQDLPALKPEEWLASLLAGEDAGNVRAAQQAPTALDSTSALDHVFAGIDEGLLANPLLDDSGPGLIG